MSQYLLHAAWALFLAFNVFFNYSHCAFTHPGKPNSFLPSNAISDSEDEVTEDDEDGGTRCAIQFTMKYHCWTMLVLQYDAVVVDVAICPVLGYTSIILEIWLYDRHSTT